MMKMKIYIMNPPKFSDRKLLLEKKLSGLDFHYEFLSINDKAELSEEGLKKNHDRQKTIDSFGRDFTGGEIASTLNHLCAYRKFLDSGDSFALILEDDVTFDASKFASIIDAFLRRGATTAEAEVILFTPVNEYLKANTLEINNDYKLVTVVETFGAQAYLINRLAAENALKTNEKSWILCDDWVRLRRHAKIKISSIFPPIAKSNPEIASNLDQDRNRTSRDQKTLKYILSNLRYKATKYLLRYLWQKPFRGYTSM